MLIGMTMAKRAPTATHTIPKGNTSVHHGCPIGNQPAMPPKDGMLGGTPTPRNDKEDSMKRPISKAKLKPTGDSAIARRKASRPGFGDEPSPPDGLVNKVIGRRDENAPAHMIATICDAPTRLATAIDRKTPVRYVRMAKP